MAKGGRGGKRRRGNPSTNDKFSPNGVGNSVPNSLSEALGAKGKPMSEANAWFDANPYYSDKYAEFSSNCQRCVFAYEMRRRGYDVIAQPTYKGDSMPYGANWTGAMKGMSRVAIGKSTEKATIKNIEKQMSSWGEGSRAIIRIKWAGGNSGHVINCEQKNGKLHVYDVQSNKRVTGVKYLEKYLPYATLSHTELFRTDNATPTDDMRFMVRTSKK